MYAYMVERNVMTIKRLVQGYECLSACLGYYMNEYYPEITGSDICIYGGALNVSYDMETHILSTPMYDSNYVFLKENAITYIHDCLDTDDVDVFVFDCMDRDKKLILKVCSEQLSYNRVFKQAEHSTHFINIVGETENQYHVVDCYVPTREPSVFDGFVDKEEIKSAWKGKKYEYLILEKICFDYVSVCEKVKEVIVKSIQEYCGLSSLSNRQTGEDAVLQLFSYIGNEVANPILHEITMNINYQLKIYGFVSSKIMLTKVLRRYLVCDDLCTMYEAVILNWNNICMHLVKLGITRKREQYDKLMEKVTQLMKTERDILLGVLEKLQSV